MRFVEIVSGHHRRDEFNRHQAGSLMEQLEHRMLGIGANPAPCYRRSQAVDRIASACCRLAVRFHFELLEIGRQQC